MGSNSGGAASAGQGAGEQGGRDGDTGTPPGPDPLALARKIEWLFTHVSDATGRRFTNQRVADYIEARLGVSCSKQYVAALRKGGNVNPTRLRLEGLAACFGVTPVYLSDDPARAALIQSVLELSLAARDGDIRAIKLRDLSAALDDAADRISVDEIDLLSTLLRSIGRGDATASKHPEDIGDAGPAQE